MWEAKRYPASGGCTLRPLEVRKLFHKPNCGPRPYFPLAEHFAVPGQASLNQWRVLRMKLPPSRLLLLIAIAALLAVSIPAIVSAQEPPPNRFYGAVRIDGNPAPPGTPIEAFARGVSAAKTTVTSAGRYLFDVPRLSNGTPLTFKVSGYDVVETATWQQGQRTPLDLNASSVAAQPTEPPPTVAPTPRPTVRVVRPTPNPITSRPIPGPQGEQGEKGDPGLQGPPGLAGAQGLRGIPGADGVSGQAGPKGLSGDQGPEGERGPRGLQGVGGQAGPQGGQGITGAQGNSGNALLAIIALVLAVLALLVAIGRWIWELQSS